MIQHISQTLESIREITEGVVAISLVILLICLKIFERRKGRKYHGEKKRNFTDSQRKSTHRNKSHKNKNAERMAGVKKNKEKKL